MRKHAMFDIHEFHVRCKRDSLRRALEGLRPLDSREQAAVKQALRELRRVSASSGLAAGERAAEELLEAEVARYGERLAANVEAAREELEAARAALEAELEEAFGEGGAQ